MAAGAQVKSDFDGPEDRQLADDIARAMHHRPLMSRLQRVEVMHGNAAGAVAKSATRLAPVPSAPALPKLRRHQFRSIRVRLMRSSTTSVTSRRHRPAPNGWKRPSARIAVSVDAMRWLG